MDPVPGYAIASWEQGYGDFAITPDLGDAAPDPVARGTALVLGDVGWHDGVARPALAAAGAARPDRAGRARSA